MPPPPRLRDVLTPTTTAQGGSNGYRYSIRQRTLCPTLEAGAVRFDLVRSWEKPTEKTSTAVELPLSEDAKRVLSLADRERGKTTFTDPHHLLLGIMGQSETQAARVVLDRGITVVMARDRLKYLDKRLQPKRAVQGRDGPSEAQILDLTALSDDPRELAFY